MPLSLHDTINCIETLAPPQLAEPWDNVGLLVEAAGKRNIKTVLLTIDLTRAVLEEAIAKKAELLIAYHPPIFNGLKQLSRSNPRTAVLLDCLQNRISVYSPHTALDSAQDGVSDWLSNAFSFKECRIIGDQGLDAPYGPGRLLTLKRASSYRTLAKQFQIYSKLPYIRKALAAANPGPIRTVALCPGAGTSLLKQVDADLVITGEMRHHDALDFTERGQHVLISEHSWSERAYLPVFASRLRSTGGRELAVLCSRKDHDPITLH